MQYQYIYVSRVDHVLTHVMLKTNNYQLSFVYSYIYSNTSNSLRKLRT